ncbi:MAG: hypothetical protein ACR2PJ_02970, partial [Pseudomonadales bacterium]
ADQVLAEQTDAGDAALTAGDAKGALTAFTIATAIAPEDASLAAKLHRAENLDEVLDLTSQAAALEREGKLDQALAIYRDAVSLDGAWPPSTEGAARVAQAIKQGKFTDAMSRGFAALAANDYAAAKQGFAEAAAIFPDSSEPDDGLLQVEQKQNSDRIATRRQAAEAALATDDWPTAIAEYEAALTIDAALVFAADGLAYAQQRQQAEAGLIRFISDPTLLQDDDHLQDAKSALIAASQFSDKSASTQGYIDTLAKLVSAARVELPVVITSDGQTDVTVWKVGRLGKLNTHNLSLIPGRYTLVGKRQNYRDVRKDLILLPTTPTPKTINITCNEPI